MRTLALFTLLVATPSFAADLKLWDGKYKPSSIQFEEAEQITDTDGKTRMTLVVKEGEYRMFWHKDTSTDLHVRLFTADLTIDAASKTFTLSVKDGQKKGQVMHGIFEKTATELKLCYAPNDKPRPTTFTAAKGSGCFLEVWTVAK